MPVGKRNEWLDADDGDNISQDGYDSEKDELQRGRGPAKRQKLDDSSDEEGSQKSLNITSREGASVTSNPSKKRSSPQSSESMANLEGSNITKTKSLKPLNLQSLAKDRRDLSKTGVIYISRIPPFMKPHRIRSLLSPHASKGLGRIFLTPESHEHRTARRRKGGNKKKSFVDGWVEFLSKKDAKTVTELLNTQIVGGKKGSWYHDDIWNIRYLHRYKWADLMEQVKNEEKEREIRLRTEEAKVRKQEKAFDLQTDQAKILRTRQEKQKRRDEKSAAANGNAKVSNEDGSQVDELGVTQTQGHHELAISSGSKKRLAQVEEYVGGIF
ncbi:MAG: RNA-binding ATPase activator esf2 [Vezdaea aestivalis]|nr:MAG: RNA-binding ATPase activator esf2 [Vezdaea aestivalis]